jgi:uncharacterized protein YdeI (YjbR/CyaY-like superfamily)
MAAFKEHCAFGFWKGSLIIENPSDTAMGQLGRIARIRDLPPKKTLTSWIRKAMKLNAEGVKVPRAKPAEKHVQLPQDLHQALAKSARARSTFEGFSPSHKARVRGMDRGGEAPGDPSPQAHDRGGLDGRGKIPPLEVR